MKKIALRSLTLASIVAGFVSNSAFAEDAAAAPTASKFTPTLRVAMRYVLLDSTRKTNFDFLNQDVRIGAKYSDGALTAAARVRFLGNNYGQHATSNADSTGGQGAGVDTAYIGYDLYKNDDIGTVNFTIGRFFPNGANSYGDDAQTYWFAMSGYFAEDGVALTYSGKPGGVDLTAQLAVVNSMQLYLFKSSTIPGQPGNVWGFSTGGSSSSFRGGSTFNYNGGGDFNNAASTSNTSDKAFIGSVLANVEAGPGTVEVALSYGVKNNSIGNTVTNSATAPAASTIVANDVQYTEDSIGYNYKDQLKAGVWYSLAMIGVDKNMTDANGGATQFAENNGTAENKYSVAGLGIQGDSSLFGMTDVFTKGGLLTYAAGATAFMHRQSGTGAVSDSDAAKNDVTLVSVGGGYTKGKFSTELNVSHFISENNVFLNQGGNAGTDSADFIYLVAGVSL